MSTCPRCQQEFTCAMADNTGKACWCTALPPIAFSKLPGGVLDLEASCFCPNCLPLWKAEREAASQAQPENDLLATCSERASTGSET